MLKAGAARAIITPPVGLDLSGFSFGPSTGVLDDLEAQALVLTSGGQSIALVAADLIGFDSDFVAAVRKRCEAAWGIPAANILLAGSHTHSGPATQFVRHWGERSAEYMRVLESHLVGLVGVAHRAAQEARIGRGEGDLGVIAENRRATTGLIDPAVPVLRVDDASGTPIALVYGYACHPISLHSYHNLISPDYPGYARSVLQAVLGPKVVVLFLQGAAGDIHPHGYVDGYLEGQDTPARLARARQIGAMLGCEAAKTALGVETHGDVTLGARSTVVDLPVEPLPVAAELRLLREQCDREAARLRAEGRPEWEAVIAEIQRDWAGEALLAREALSPQRTRRCEIQGIRVGDAAILALPLEVFVETGLAIKAASPAALNVISSMSNGALGYLPTADAYVGEDYTNPQGLAPKVYDLYAFSPDAEPLVRREAVQILHALDQG